MTDSEYMRIALTEAEKCSANGEAPIGALIVRNGEIISASGNARETLRLASAHAEIIAINEACRVLGGWRLTECTLYVTLEPCVMCAGAIINSRIPRVVIGAADAKAGAFGGLFSILGRGLNHTPEICFGVMADECSAILKDFFRLRRSGGGIDINRRWKDKNGK